MFPSSAERRRVGCVERRFGGTYHFHLQDRKFSRARNRRAAGSLLIFDPKDGGDIFL
jgi:hypothetical protein